ncbi:MULTISPECIES: hypothetical protein [unclassified Nostoc]|uniref:hypothetical protein n=1 Tax=unclassified Nostoc TaxID=2593658 RepID=UPI0025AAA68B|nr:MULTISPECIES: hypothetical protein [unclassified Nostoc]MDM9584218.1 hypothetical protein [Nostoc sp. GT001]MDZ7947871.1 hypothetical protein [Nostoc sp. EfeVER01]MDZ7994332.1 hypothetical protein [Nostoc sp. EspVER01]
MSQDEPTLLSGSQHETINCWDIAIGECRQTLRMVNPAAGLTEAEMSTLKPLEAVEVNSSCSMPTNFR